MSNWGQKTTIRTKDVSNTLSTQEMIGLLEALCQEPGTDTECVFIMSWEVTDRFFEAIFSFQYRVLNLISKTKFLRNNRLNTWSTEVPHLYA